MHPSATVTALFEIYSSSGKSFHAFCRDVQGDYRPHMAPYCFKAPRGYPNLTDSEWKTIVDGFDAEMVRQGKPNRAIRF